MSAANVSSIVTPGTTVVLPYPRKSAAITRQPEAANAATCGAHIDRSNGWPCTSTSGGPLPSSSYAMVMPLTAAVAIHPPGNADCACGGSLLPHADLSA